MKHTKTVQVPATTKEVVEFVTCDLCDERIYKGGLNEDDVTLTRRTGYRGPDCGSGTLTTYDICGNCCETRLFPWLTSQSATPTVTDWDY